MESKNIIYQIRSLEKMLARVCINDPELKEKIFLKNGKTLKITPAQIQILGYMLEHPKEDIYQKDLEAVLKLRRATVSGILKTMEKNNLITRVIDKEDKRVKRLELTEYAKSSFRKAKNKIENLESSIINGINNKDLEVFLNVMEKMKKNIEKDVNSKTKLEIY